MPTREEENWVRFFVSGTYAQAWGMMIDSRRTEAEVEGVLKLLDPPPGSHILDWCGGWGRHAIELVKKGYQVTLLDFAPNHIEMARKAAVEAGVELGLICADFRSTPALIQAEFAVNLLTSGLSYLTEDDDVAALKALHAALKPGAKVLIDMMSLFWLVQHYNPRGWRQTPDGKVRYFEERWFDFLTNRNYSSGTLLVEGELEKQITIDHRIYSASELAAVLRKAGFEPVALYGDFDGSEFTFDSRRIVMIAERM